MKDLVDNRSRLPVAAKLRALSLVLRENGVAWSTWLCLYYAASSLGLNRIAEPLFQRLESLRRQHRLPGLSSVALNEAIWDHWDWSLCGEEWTLSRDWKESMLRSVLDAYLPTGGHVLELGPGAGRWTAPLAARSESLLGVDLSEACVRRCEKRFADAEHVEFVTNEGSELPTVPDASVDAIWSYDVFVHINEAETRSYFAEFARVLRAGGRGVVHHGTSAGRAGGWRSDLDGESVLDALHRAGLEPLSQFQDWHDGERTYPVGRYDDAITVFRKPLADVPSLPRAAMPVGFPSPRSRDGSADGDTGTRSSA